MGRPTSRDFEDELVLKFKALFDKIVDGVNKENPSYPFDFERFVDSFNTDDYITKQVFEYLVKEAARNYRRSNPYDRIPPFPRPPTIHHTASSIAPPGGAGASSPYTSLSSSLSSLAFDNPQHHDRVHSDGSQSEGEPAGGASSVGGVGTSTGVTSSTPVAAVRRGLQRSLNPNSTASSGSMSRAGRFHRPWDQGTTGPDLEILTQMFNRSRERRRSRERAGATLGGSRQNPLLENDNSDDSDTSDDSIYESITHSRSIMATMHDLDPSPTHSPGRNTSQSTASRPSNSVSFAQLYPPLSASPSSPTTFASPPSLHSTFSPANYWDSSTAVRADRLQRMSRYVFDDSGTARLRQPGYSSSFRHNWRQHNRRLERYRASASLLDTLSGGGGRGQSSASSSASTLQPSTAIPSLTPRSDLSTTTTSTSATLGTARSGRRLSEPLITGRPESTSSFSGSGIVRGMRDFVAAPTEDRYTSFAEASSRGRAALRSAALALDDTLDLARNMRNRHGPEEATNAPSSSSSSSSSITVHPTPSASASSSVLAAPVSSTSTSSSNLARAVLLDENCELGESTSSSLGVTGPSEEIVVASLSVARESAGRRRRRSSMTPTRSDSPYPTVDNMRADSPFPEIENNRDDSSFPGGRRADSPYPEVTEDGL